MKGNKWLMFIVVYLCSLTVAISHLKIPPLMSTLASNMNISISLAGWLMALFTLAGLLLAVPGGAIMNIIGPKHLLMALMGCITCGNLLGFAASNFYLLLLSRAIEGIAFSMIMTVSIYIISLMFERGSGLAMGIYNTFFPAGSFITMTACLPVTKALGYKSLWVMVGLLGLVCVFLVQLVLELPEKAGGHNIDKVSIREAAKNYRIWLLALSMGVVAFMMLACLSTYPYLFENLYRLGPERANFYASLNGLAGIPFSIVAGLLVDKTQKPYLFYLSGMVGLIITAFTFNLLGPKTYMLHPLLSSFAGSVSMTTIFYLAPFLAKRPEHIGYSIAFVNQIYFLGDFASSPVTFWVIERSGFAAAKYLMLGLTAAGFMLAASQYLRHKKAGSGEGKAAVA